MGLLRSEEIHSVLHFGLHCLYRPSLQCWSAVYSKEHMSLPLRLPKTSAVSRWPGTFQLEGELCSDVLFIINYRFVYALHATQYLGTFLVLLLNGNLYAAKNRPTHRTQLVTLLYPHKRRSQIITNMHVWINLMNTYEKQKQLASTLQFVH